jgi:hypothetical protein
VSLLKDAAHDVRVVLGVVLAMLAAGVFYYDEHDARSLASRDFALCGAAQIRPGCTSRHAAVFTGWTASSSNGFHRVYHVSVATGRHSTETIGGLSKAEVAPFESLGEAELRYRQGRLTAIVGTGGATVKVPFAFTRKAVELAGISTFLVLAGGGLFAWGFARLNNRPRPPASQSRACV